MILASAFCRKVVMILDFNFVIDKNACIKKFPREH